MTKKNILLLFLLITCTTLIFNSCSSTQLHIEHNRLTRETLPRESFIYVKKTLSIYKCLNDRCVTMNFNSSGSGFVVRVETDGSYIITAGHVCENRVPSAVAPDKINAEFTAHRLDGEGFKAIVLDYNKEHDVCMMFAPELTEKIQPVLLSYDAPKPGDKVFNISAPKGLFQANSAPIIEGRFNGDYNKSDWYTLPAAPGCSGSMIVNVEGKLIGMVHSVFIDFPFMTLSTDYNFLKGYIEANLQRYTTYKNVMELLELENIFTAGAP